MNNSIKSTIKLIAGLTALLAGAGQANATAYTATADTFVYQFLGNLPAQGVGVWNHETTHGARGLLDFNSIDSALSSLTAGAFSATLNVYLSCVPGGFIASCPGDADAGSPGGKAAVTTDIFAKTGGVWNESGTITWASVGEGTKLGTFTVNSNTGGWLSIDATAIVEYWRALGNTGDGLVFSQEAYPVVRNDAGSLVALMLSDKEASGGIYASYIDVQAVPVPAAAWLFGSALLGLGGVSRRRASAK
jgi:hypothetical protein